MHVGEALVARARAAEKRSIVVVGTGKNVGKTVTVTALADALVRSGVRFGIASIGRDGEAIDALEGTPKPRIFLRGDALLATAAPLLPAHPAVEIVAATNEESALGPIVLARVRAPGFFEIAGPPSAAALRLVVGRLFAGGAEIVLVDGAVDRIAALREEDAVVVATGAAIGPTPARVVEETATLVSCLRLPAVDRSRAAVEIEGALTAATAAALVRAGERRQIVVRDPTKIVAGGRAFAALQRGLDLRCERPLHPVACTAASIASVRAFEPASFLRLLAQAVELPCYDVYAGAAA
jgi:hypothetical protein